MGWSGARLGRRACRNGRAGCRQKTCWSAGRTCSRRPTLAACPAARTIRSARARCISIQDGKDTLYRIHGTNEPEKIGQGVSSGCIRMRDIDAIDLYNRVKIGTPVVVI